jgi:adenylate kinase family enzyme
MKRVVIIGPSGSGKATLGQWIGRHVGLPFTNLDDLHWRPAWVEAPLREFRAAVDSVAQASRCVVAGNYAEARDLVWLRADTLVWLDLPLAQVLWRSTSRALRHSWTREPICNGYRRTPAQLVNGRDSLIGYTLHTFRQRRREWTRLRPETRQSTDSGRRDRRR